MTSRTLIPLQLLVVALTIGAWQWAVANGHLDPTTWSRPSDVADVLSGWFGDGSIWQHIGATLTVIALGYALGVVLGVAVGIAVGSSQVARAYFEPFLVFWNATPSVILVPVFVVLLGYGTLPKILLVFLAIVFLVTINVSAGVRSIEGDLIANARALGASRWHLARDVMLPALALWIAGSARLAVGISFQVAIVAEFFGAFKGLGYLIVSAQEQFDVAAIYAALVVTMALAWIADVLLGALQAWSTRWMPGRLAMK